MIIRVYDKSMVFKEKVVLKALLALGEATAAVLVCDGQQGITTLDRTLADWLRKNNKV